jgi:hypothetical protein
MQGSSALLLALICEWRTPGMHPDVVLEIMNADLGSGAECHPGPRLVDDGVVWGAGALAAAAQPARACHEINLSLHR